MKKKILYVLLLIIFLLAACAPQGGVVVTERPEEVTEVIPTETTAPTAEPTFTPAATLTNTATIAPTATPVPTETLVPTPVVNFDEVRIIGVDKKSGYSSVIFLFPVLDQLYQVKINNAAYNCQIPEGIVDRLFCSGQEMRTDEYAEVIFFDDETYQNQLAALTMFVPKPVPTPLPAGDPNTWCPARGTNVSCETEHRTEFGEECWVQTCFDACGYYYSYHTCQLPPHNNFLPP